jgi:WD repeat-containing protein 35
MLEELLGYILEALEIIEIPPEPPEQAGRSLYERLEIASMRNQLIRRAMDLKKNLQGLHKLLDNLREMSLSISEAKLFSMNESVDLNTKRICTLQDSNERAAGTLQVLQVIFGGILAFNILDRVTGNNWSVIDSQWFSNFYDSIIQDIPMMWFGVSIVVWLLLCLVFYRIHKNYQYLKQGLTTIRIKVNRKIFIQRIQQFLLTKFLSQEEHQYDDNADIVRLTYTEKHKREWGYSLPTITLEYDEKNSYLFSITILYNRHQAHKKLVMSADELKRKVLADLTSVGIWDEQSEDHSKDDLAADKRAALNHVGDDYEIDSSN